MLKTKALNAKEFFEKSFENTEISEERKDHLSKISNSIVDVYKLDSTVHLNFI